MRILIKHIFLVSLALFFGFGIALFPVRHLVEAQTWGGAVMNTMFIQCTCGDGYLTFIQGAQGTPSGLYYFSSKTQNVVGSGQSSQVGFMEYTPGAGICVIEAGEDCVDITASDVSWWGGNQ